MIRSKRSHLSMRFRYFKEHVVDHATDQIVLRPIVAMTQRQSDRHYVELA
jgi:hypothetical protein